MVDSAGPGGGPASGGPSGLQGFTGTLGPQASYTQSPRFKIYLNGKVVLNPIEVVVTSNNYSEAARFTASFVPTIADQQLMLGNGTDQLTIEIMMTLSPQSTPQSMIYGLVDNVDWDVISNHVDLSGRDLSSLLLDTQIQVPFSNLTSSQIIETFTIEHAAQGLKAEITPTQGLVGRFYGTDYSENKFGDLYRPTNEWNMAMMLAQGEGFDLRMGGRNDKGKLLDSKTLYFGPAPPDSSKTYGIVIQQGPPVVSNAETIKVSRYMTMAKDVQVNVIAWSSLQARPIIKSLKKSAGGTGGGSGTVQQYTFRMPGDATPEQAVAYANAKMREITAFERVVEIQMPLELAMNPSDSVKLVGTGTDADQVYYIDSIERGISFDKGGTQHVRLKNHSPYSISLVS